MPPINAQLQSVPNLNDEQKALISAIVLALDNSAIAENTSAMKDSFKKLDETMAKLDKGITTLLEQTKPTPFFSVENLGRLAAGAALGVAANRAANHYFPKGK